jgi:hypothetical protein
MPCHSTDSGPCHAAADLTRVLCYGDSLTAGLAGNFVTKYAPYASRLQELCESKTSPLS